MSDAVSATQTIVSTPAPIVVAWGVWIANIMQAITPLVAGLAVAAFVWAVNKLVSHLPPDLAAALTTILKQYQVDNLINKGVDYSFAAVEGAVRGKSSTVAIANAQVAAVTQYIVDNAPEKASELGETLVPKIIARLSAAGVIPPEASVVGSPTVLSTAADPLASGGASK